MVSYAVTLLSGGLDSSTVTALAKNEVSNLTALTFHYGQSHSKEIDCAKAISKSLKVEHTLLDISFIEKISWYSALTNPEKFPIMDEYHMKFVFPGFSSILDNPI